MAEIALSDSIPFGEWLPDAPDYKNQGATIAKNCLTNGLNYKPLPSLQEISDSLGERVFGAASFFLDGVTYTFAGTEEALWIQNGLGWTDVSKSGGYSTATDGRWVFKNYGKLIIATNYVDDMQSYLIGTSTEFDDLDASAPKAKSIDIVNNFVVAINTVDGDGAIENRVKWSALDGPTDWTPNAATLSDYQNVEGDGGANTAIVGSQNYAVLLQERNIWRMEFEGPPSIFRFTLAEKDRGTKVAGSVAALGRYIFYYGEDGFYRFDGSDSVPIGTNKINRWFSENLDASNAHRMTTAVDPINNIVTWSFAGSGNSNGTPNLMLIYNVVDNRFTFAEQEVDLLFQAVSTGYTLEGLDAISTSLDALPYSLDSRAWSGGKSLFAAFTTDNKLAYFQGANMTATLETGEIQPNGQGTAYIDSVLPEVDGGSITASVGYRNTLQDVTVYDAPSSINMATGECPQRISTRYARVLLVISGAWNDAVGIKARVKPEGLR